MPSTPIPSADGGSRPPDPAGYRGQVSAEDVATEPVAGGVAVLGLGNVLVGDDGAGVAAVAELVRRYVVPPEVSVLDGGVLGLHLLGLLEDTRHVLVLDTVRTGREPGALVRLEGERLRAAFSSRMSVHELGFTEVLAAAELRGRRPAHLVVLGIEPQQVEQGIGLSAPVAGAVGPLADAAAAELRSWGVPVTVRADPPEALPYPQEVLGLGGGGRDTAAGGREAGA